jgi:NADPH:quinone reductase-like Zn-dependent oxidoreductase
VLIHAAASGVGIAAIQLARFYGAYVGRLSRTSWPSYIRSVISGEP